MQGLQFAILHHGWIYNDIAINISMAQPATKSEPRKKGVFWKVPTLSTLIRHPEMGYILYDCGPFPEGQIDERQDFEKRKLYMEYGPEHALENQLALCGIGPEDVSIIVLSHCHWDHIGGLSLFRGTEAAKHVYIGKADFGEGLVRTHLRHEDVPTTYKLSYLEVDGIDYTYVEGDMQLCPGIRLIELGGHTRGVLGMLIEAESGNYILPSDAVYSKMNYGPPMRVPGVIYDSLSFIKGVNRLYELEKRFDASLIFPHDLEQMGNIKTAPHFY